MVAGSGVGWGGGGWREGGREGTTGGEGEREGSLKNAEMKALS